MKRIFAKKLLDNINIFKSITQGVIITMIILSVNIRSKSKEQTAH